MVQLGDALCSQTLVETVSVAILFVMSQSSSSVALHPLSESLVSVRHSAEVAIGGDVGRGELVIQTLPEFDVIAVDILHMS